MRATTPSMGREARRQIRFLSDRLLPTLPTFYFLRDATILLVDRVM
jgi:hypothetical protein